MSIKEYERTLIGWRKMINIDIGGARGHEVSPVKDKWKVLDIKPENTNYRYDLNSGKPFPLHDGEVDNYYTSRTIECVRLDKIQFVINEIYRTLKTNGKVRVITLDASVEQRISSKKIQDPIVFDKKSLTHYFGNAGFDVNTIEWLEHGVCSDVFKLRDNPKWANRSLYMEIKK
jgi:ubiquinone/menaquinone biosynthesis C-methylase UbiE